MVESLIPSFTDTCSLVRLIVSIICSGNMIHDIDPIFHVTIPFGNFDFILRSKAERLIRSSVVAPEPVQHPSTSSQGGFGNQHLQNGDDIAHPSVTLDVRSHTLHLPPYTLQSLVPMSDWNRFMFSEDGVRRFVVCSSASLICMIISALFVTPQTFIWQILFLISWLFCIVCPLMAAIHWVDIQIFKRTIRQFDCVYVITYAVIYQFAEVYLWALSPSTYYLFSMVVVVTSSVGYVCGVILFLATDGIPKRFASHRFQLLIYSSGMLYHIYIWIIRAYTQLEHTDGSIEVCLYACTSIVQLSASASFTLAVFFAKFALSLIIWPTNAVFLRTKVVLQNLQDLVP
jgi:hypothetical protein